MGWDDIDFDRIKTGMITRGPSEISWTNYLNTFHKALIERQIFRDGGSEPPSEYIPPFEQFQILDIQEIKNLIAGYYTLWNSRTYYTFDVMSDPINFANYEITEQDLIDEITQEVFDILKDLSSLPFYKVYRADVFHALYTIYEFTRYYRSSISNSLFDSYPFSQSDSNIRYNSGGPSRLEAPGFDDSSFDAAFNASKGAFAPFGGGGQSKIEYGYSYRWGYDTTPGEEWRVDMDLTGGAPEAIIKQYDLGGNILQSSISIASSVINSTQFEVTRNISNNMSIDKFTGVYPNNNYMTIVGGLLNYYIPIIPTFQMVPDGTLFSISTPESSGDIPIKVNPHFNEDPSYRISGSCGFRSEVLSQPTFIDLNNPALEFYIPEDE